MACKPILSNRANRVPFSRSFNREELCHCTEELGSESISCRSSGMEGTSTAMQNQGKHRGSSQPASTGCDERNVRIADAKWGTLPKAADVSCKSGKSLQFINHGILPSFQGASKSIQHVRRFPPPVSSLSSGDRPILRSFKFNGRFVLQRVKSTFSSPFHSLRENGRLKLILAASHSGLDRNEVGEHAVTRGSNKEYLAITSEIDDEQKLIAQGRSSLVALHNAELEMQFAEQVLLPRSMNLFNARDWDSTRGLCGCLPTVGLLLERTAHKLSYKVQPSHGSLIINVQQLHSEIDEAKSRGPFVMSPGLPHVGEGNQHSSPIINRNCIMKASSTQLEKLQSISASNTLCGPHKYTGALSKKDHGYAILSLSFSGLILLVVMECTSSAETGITIKGVDIYHYNNVQAAASKTTSCYTAEYALQYNDQIAGQHVACSESKPEPRFHDTWLTSKPIDFRISA